MVDDGNKVPGQLHIWSYSVSKEWDFSKWLVTELHDINRHPCCVGIKNLTSTNDAPSFAAERKDYHLSVSPTNLTTKRAIYLYRVFTKLKMCAARGVLPKSYSQISIGT